MLSIVPLSVNAAELIKELIVPNFLSVLEIIFLQSFKFSKSAFTNMIAALNLFALQIGRSRNLPRAAGRSLVKAMRELPTQAESIINSSAPYQEAVQAIKDAKSVLFLGRGFSAPVANEGALKLMEIAYIPCLAYPAGEMKHGPLALIEEGLPVIVIAPKDKYYEKTLSNTQEVIARGGKIFFITDNDKKLLSTNIRFRLRVPRVDNFLSPLLLTIPLQLLAYHVALLKNCDIDKPRNLAKSVTVE